MSFYSDNTHELICTSSLKLFKSIIRNFSFVILSEYFFYMNELVLSSMFWYVYSAVFRLLMALFPTPGPPVDPTL